MSDCKIKFALRGMNINTLDEDRQIVPSDITSKTTLAGALVVKQGTNTKYPFTFFTASASVAKWYQSFQDVNEPYSNIVVLADLSYIDGSKIFPYTQAEKIDKKNHICRDANR